MTIIDPLKIKIEELLVQGQSFPLQQGLQRYGTESDIDNLVNCIRKIEINTRRYVYVDLSPFERIGHIDILIKKLHEIKLPRLVLIVMSERVLHEINIAYRNSPIKIAYYSIAGELISISEGSEIDKQFKNQIENDLQADTIDSKIEYLRNWYAEEKLTQLLFKQNCIDIPGPKDNENTVEYISGRYYRKMTNGMLVSCYLNIKEIGSSYNALTDIAFEIVEELENNFRRDKDYLNTFDVLVTPSNTALLIAATVQAIIEKPVICVDRLGPIPILQLQTQKLKKVLHGKKVIVIEEITATGNEIDRTIMFLNHLGASIVKIIVVYNLEVGIAMLAKPGEIISLCHPKKELAYVYRSK